MNILLLSLPLITSGGGASALAPTSAPARATELQITSQGAFEHQQTGNLLLHSSTSQAMTVGGALWTHTDGGAAWIAEAVSIGNCASQVFGQHSLNNQSAQMLSVYDSDPPTPIWTDNAVLGNLFAVVDSAADTDTHVAISQIVLGGNGATRQAVLNKYSSGSATPDWSYTFAPIINAAAKVGISRDGQTIVAAIMNDATLSLEVAVFGPGSGTPLSYTVLPAGTSNSLRGWDLSADGSTLYFSQGTTANIYDVANQTTLFSTGIGASFDSHAISGDGSVFAFGNFNTMKVWEFNGATYVNTNTKTKGGSVYCARIDISDDSSTVAYGWYYYSPGLTVVIEAMDVASGGITMSETVTGSGTLQNTIAGISCSADGSRFGVGLWGDGGNLAEELRLYSSTQNAPLQTLNLAGSIFTVDLSADGQRLVGGGKATHANTFGSGGHVEVLDAGGEDLMAHGAPRVGATIQLEVHGGAGAPSLLLSANLPQDPPVAFPGIGTLYVKRSILTITSLGAMSGTGQGLFPHTLPSGAALVGTNQYLQVLFLSPRVLTADFLKLTLLP